MKKSHISEMDVCRDRIGQKSDRVEIQAKMDSKREIVGQKMKNPYLNLLSRITVEDEKKKMKKYIIRKRTRFGFVGTFWER